MPGGCDGCPEGVVMDVGRLRWMPEGCDGCQKVVMDAGRL